MQICSYGCGKEGIYKFKNGKFCCNKNVHSCLEFKKKFTGDKHPFLNKKHKDESKLKTSINCRNSWTNEMREKQRQNMLNGGASKANCYVTPSKPQKVLFEIIKNLYKIPCFINYNFLNYSLDIVILKYKIIIEYDGSFFHQDLKKDNERQKEIEKYGWVFLRYIDRIPLIEELKNSIDLLIKEQKNRGVY